MSYRFKKNVTLDATMVMAIRKTMFEPWAMAQGLKPDEAFARMAWLPKQHRRYLHQVERKIAEIEQKNLMDSIGK